YIIFTTHAPPSTALSTLSLHDALPIYTYGFTTEPDKVGVALANIGVNRTLGYASHGAGGMLMLFLRGAMCNWMVSMGVVGAMISDRKSTRLNSSHLVISYAVFCLKKKK